MPTTSNGLPYPASTAPPNVPVDIKALADALNAAAKDSTWVNLPKAAAVTAGVLKYRQLGLWVCVFINVTANTATGAFVRLDAGGLPSGLWPSVSAFTGGWFSGYPGSVFVGNSGDVSAQHQSGATRQAVAGVIVYPIGA